ncbi:MAG: HvfB family MNIO-type RiPP peptide maturase [Dokdonella sp.]|uniref:HvfB family MNIO-type RiPP peptide maturase n=1 Tax=Dokdonella sp. TaxID=2291710 RepID=UPI003F7FDAAB
MSLRSPALHGAGLGLRRALLGPLQEHLADAEPGRREIDFFEIAPENWIGVGGKLGRSLRALTERHPFVCHGLSLSLGGPEPLDDTLLARIRRLLDTHGIALYSEHLSYCSDDGHLYDLMPIPFTEEAVRHVSARIRQTQDVLGQRIAVENVSYYAAPSPAMSEIEFIDAVLREADCDLLLDVNNIHVNSVNHGYDAAAFLDALPGGRIAYIHVAGHYVEAPDLLVDTHGAAIIDPVWKLLARAYRNFGVRPTLVERDFNFPPLAELLGELHTIHAIQADHGSATRDVRSA